MKSWVNSVQSYAIKILRTHTTSFLNNHGQGSSTKSQILSKVSRARMSTTFTFFPLLPTEIRLKIWDFALHLFQRILEATPISYPLDPSHHPQNFIQLPRWIVTPNSIPTLLCISREPRYYFLPLYNIHFDSVVTMCRAANLSFNPGNDILFFNKWTIRSSVPMSLLFDDLFPIEDLTEVRKRLRTISGCRSFWKVLLQNNAHYTLLRDFENLEEEIIVIEKEQTRMSNETLAFEDLVPGSLDPFKRPWLKSMGSFLTDVRFCRETWRNGSGDLGKATTSVRKVC